MQDIMPPVDTVDNLFHDGNPVTGEQGTIVSAEFLNNLQGATRDTQTELKSILTAAGIAIDPDKQNQVLTALSKLYLSRVNPGADIAADGAAAIATFLANLRLGGAAKLSAATGVLSGSGYIKIPLLVGTTERIFILQWGSISNGGSGISGSATYPIVFPTAAIGGAFGPLDTENGGFCLAFNTRTLSGFTAVFRDVSNAVYPHVPTRLQSSTYIVLGY